MDGDYLDVIGPKCNTFTNIKVRKDPISGKFVWICTCCVCGETKEYVVVWPLVYRTAKCGCQSNATGNSLYRIWIAIHQRCNNKNTSYYKNYGGRGITVCERWDNFDNFLKDMGPRPHGMSIDRIDNNGNYSPENCRWATPQQQAENRRNVIMLNHNGESLSKTQWAKKLGISRQALAVRIQRKGLNDPAIFSAKYKRM